MSISYRILITGCNRGIGLELVKHAVRKRWRVHACVRTPDISSSLHDVVRMSGGLISLHIVDVGDPAQIQALAYELRQSHLDILINNAGVYGADGQDFGHTDVNDWLHTLRINCIGPMKMAEALQPHLLQGQRKLILNISSRMGSMDDNRSGGNYIYRSSKAALNAITKSMAIDLAPQGFCCISLHPGWALTEMGGPDAEISAATSAQRILAMIDRLRPEHNGGFFETDGSHIAW